MTEESNFSAINFVLFSAIRNEIRMIEEGKLDKMSNPLKVSSNDSLTTFCSCVV